MKIAIIGHGPSVINQGYRIEIDRHDLVVRMANCDWQPVEDYGTRYDIGVFSDGISKNYAMMSERFPNAYYWYYRTEPMIRHLKDIDSTFRGIKTEELRQSILKFEENIKPDYHLSRGTAAVLAVYEKYQPESISLYGFDAVLHGFQGRMNHHPKIFKKFDNHTMKLKKGGNTHDWKAEYTLIMSLEENDIKICIR